MDKMIFRTASPDDLETLLEFEQGIVSAERPFNPTLKEGHINYYDIQALIASDNAEVAVAEVAGEMVGSGYALIKEASAYVQHDHYAYLGFMYVKPRYRGQGINQQLTEYLKDWARSRGLTEVRLDVYSDNRPAIKAYEKAGFQSLMLEMRMEL